MAAGWSLVANVGPASTRRGEIRSRLSVGNALIALLDLRSARRISYRSCRFRGELRRGAKKMSQPLSGIAGLCTLSVQNFSVMRLVGTFNCLASSAALIRNSRSSSVSLLGGTNCHYIPQSPPSDNRTISTWPGSGAPSSHSKKTRDWSLMRMLHRPPPIALQLFQAITGQHGKVAGRVTAASRRSNFSGAARSIPENALIRLPEAPSAVLLSQQVTKMKTTLMRYVKYSHQAVSVLNRF